MVETNNKEKKKLSKGAKIGIGVGAGCCGLIIIVTILMIVAYIFSPPSLKITNPKDTEFETTEYSVKVEGTSSKLDTLKINNEEIKDKNKFSKEIELKNGNNEIKVEGFKNNNVIASKTFKIYFDYDARVYLDKEKQFKSEEEKQKQELERVPSYEVARKENINNGFSAVIYVDEKDLKDYQVVNVIKDFRSKNKGTENISILVFNKNDKGEVEGAFESTDPSALNIINNKTRADYEKSKDKEQLYWFPNGLSGEKLALEIN